jgi:hypothetical protein
MPGVLLKRRAIKEAKHIALCDRGPNDVKHKIVEQVLKFMNNKPLSQPSLKFKE